jgi:flagellar assembly factor FliW
VTDVLTRLGDALASGDLHAMLAAEPPLHVLQAVDGPDASFLAVDPRSVLNTYRTGLAMGDRLKLGAADDTPLVWLVLVATDGEGASVNLRAPIVINPAMVNGCQVVPHNSLCPLRHPLSGD